MKKLLSLLLAASMLLAVAPMTVSAYDTKKISDIEAELQKGDLALNKTVIHSANALDQGANGDWTPSKLVDGSLNYNGRESTGFHSQHGTQGATKNHSEWAGVDFGELTTFDTLVVYPAQPESNRDLSVCPAFPNAFRVEVSSNYDSATGAGDWKALTIVVNGDEANAAETIYGFEPPAAEPVTINFEAVTARYVRFVGVSLTYLVDAFYLKLSELAVYNTGYTPKGYDYCENIVEGKKPTFTVGNPHNGANDGWYPDGSGLTDGDRYNMNTNMANNDYGQFTGFHSAVGISEMDFYYELGAGSTLNQVVIYPSTEKYASYQRFPTEGDKAVDKSGEHLGLYLPNWFKFYVSDDASSWTEVSGFTYSKDEASADYKPIVFDLDKVYTATYFRIAFDVPGSVKLSELEVYDTNKVLTSTPEGEKETVVQENADLAIGAAVIASGVINSGGWNQANINNGKLEEDGGFTSTEGAADTALWVGYNLGAPTRLNTIVLFSSLSTDDRDAEWAGIPKSFKIQTSKDGFNWDTVKEVTNENVPEYLTPYAYSFETVDAQYVRIIAVENYQKGSDLNKSYIQLAEMQVLYSVPTGEADSNTGKVTTDGIGAWTSVRTRDDAFDMRFVLATTDVVKAGAVVTITFETAEGTRTITRTVSETAGEDLMGLYETVSAAGVVYTAEDCSIFGCVVTDIPLNAFTKATMTVTNSAGLVILPEVSIEYNKLPL